MRFAIGDISLPSNFPRLMVVEPFLEELGLALELNNVLVHGVQACHDCTMTVAQRHQVCGDDDPDGNPWADGAARHY